MTNNSPKNCQEFNMYMSHFLETATPEQLVAYEAARTEVANWNFDDIEVSDITPYETFDVSTIIRQQIDEQLGKDTITATFESLFLGDFTNDDK